MNEDWYKSPTVLIIGGVILVAGFVLLRNQNSSSTTASTNTSSTTSGTTPVGQSYSYLDGNGVQHLIATDPNGALTSYNYSAIDTGQRGQLGSYVGMLGPGSWGQPYGGYTPSYSVDPGLVLPNLTEQGTPL